MNVNVVQSAPMPSESDHRRKPILSLIMRILVGTLFVAAGISKIGILGNFSETVAQVLRISRHSSVVIAYCIISLEIFCGAGLLLNIYTRSCTVMLGVLTTSFLFLLARAVVSQRTFICNCFGVIPVSLSNSTEFILNLIILDGLFAIFSLSSAAPTLRSAIQKWFGSAVLMLLLCGQAAAAVFVVEREKPIDSINIENIGTYFSTQHQYSFNSDRNRHIVLIRRSDFNCPACFNDFISYVNFMQQYYYNAGDACSIVGLVERAGPLEDSLAVKKWGQTNDIRFPLLFVPESIFAEFNVKKSCVVVQEPFGTVRFIYVFPGTDAGRKVLISEFTGK